MFPVTNFHLCPFISLLSCSCRLSSAFSRLHWLCAFLSSHPWAFAFLQMLQCGERVAGSGLASVALHLGAGIQHAETLGRMGRCNLHLCVQRQAWCAFLARHACLAWNVLVCVSQYYRHNPRCSMHQCFFFSSLLSLCRMSICFPLLGRALKSLCTNQ